MSGAYNALPPARPVANIESSDIWDTSSVLSLLTCFIGRQVLCVKCLTCLTIQYGRSAVPWRREGKADGFYRLSYARTRSVPVECGLLSGCGKASERYGILFSHPEKGCCLLNGCDSGNTLNSKLIQGRHLGESGRGAFPLLWFWKKKKNTFGNLT